MSKKHSNFLYVPVYDSLKPSMVLSSFASLLYMPGEDAGSNNYEICVFILRKFLELRNITRFELSTLLREEFKKKFKGVARYRSRTALERKLASLRVQSYPRSLLLCW